ncbi:MAG: hypothetical protein DI586_10210 [Micavibrio aeruginosavorus]|uniref:Colanic acid biosynthesis glycosyltransferase WcaL n=1 Tax=Micavibrio aeruginosavorus TaxID=349221 RepID=A0A2W5FKA0_9BACT|nr:MAG: hypothetical protein DI586_10210 [Micavibrio aeruginosavorus]
MRILYLSNNFPLISETFIIHEIADLIRAGADIRILSLAIPSPAMRSSLPVELGFEDRIFYRPELKKSKLSKLWRILLLKFKGITLPDGIEDISRYQLTGKLTYYTAILVRWVSLGLL